MKYEIKHDPSIQLFVQFADDNFIAITSIEQIKISKETQAFGFTVKNGLVFHPVESRHTKSFMKAVGLFYSDKN